MPPPLDRPLATADLRRLAAAATQLAPLLDELEFEWADASDVGGPDDTSYLTEADLADRTIVANVAAMARTNRLIDWFGRDAIGWVGLWRGPNHLPPEDAPVVRLDTEGQYEIVAATVPDYLASSVLDDEDFDGARALLVGAGFTVGESLEAISAGLDRFDSPSSYRDRIYDQLL